eukprot:2271146-Rhodomonas_salina.1
MSAADEIAARTPAVRMVSQPLVLMLRVLRNASARNFLPVPAGPLQRCLNCRVHRASGSMKVVYRWVQNAKGNELEQNRAEERVCGGMGGDGGRWEGRALHCSPPQPQMMMVLYSIHMSSEQV